MNDINSAIVEGGKQMYQVVTNSSTTTDANSNDIEAAEQEQLEKELMELMKLHYEQETTTVIAPTTTAAAIIVENNITNVVADTKIAQSDNTTSLATVTAAPSHKIEIEADSNRKPFNNTIKLILPPST